MYCSQCGSQNLEGSNYCTNCGNHLNDISNNKFKYDISTKEYCEGCGTKSGDNFCIECGDSTIAIKPIKGKFNTKEILNNINIKNSKDASKIVSIAKNEIKTVIKDKDRLKNIGISVASTLGITLAASLILFLIFSNVGAVKEIYSNMKEFQGTKAAKVLPNFIDFAAVTWFSPLKMKLNFTGFGNDVNMNLFYRINMIILLVIPVLAIKFGNSKLSKKENPSIVDYVINSVAFSVVINSIFLINSHSFNFQQFGASVKYSSSVSFLDSLIWITLLHFITSMVFDLKKFIDLDNIKSSYQENILIALDSLKIFFIFSSILCISTITAFQVFFKPESSKGSIISMLIALPNILFNGINYLLGGRLDFTLSGEGITFSNFKMLKYFASASGDEPIFLLSVILVLLLFAGTIIVLTRSILKISEKDYYTNLGVLAASYGILLMLIGYLTSISIKPNIKGDTSYMSGVAGSRIDIGYYNWVSFFIPVILILGLGALIKYLRDNDQIDYIKNTINNSFKKYSMIYSAAIIILVFINFKIVADYSYGTFLSSFINRADLFDIIENMPFMQMLDSIL